MGQCVSHTRGPVEKQKQDELSETYTIDDFKFVKLIGKGGFSKVWKVEEKKTGRVFALKVMDKAKIITKKSVKAVLTERKILSRLNDSGAKFIVTIRGSFQDKANLYLLMDYMQGKSLRHHLNNGIQLTQNQNKLLIFTLLKALQSLYKQRIIHRDIKPENILFDKDGIPYLSDFGAASFFQTENFNNNSGTLGYMAPEVMQGQNHTYTADYYAIGIITYELLLKKRPYNSGTKQDLLKEISRNPVSIEHCPELKDLQPDACNFILGLLERKQRNRLGFTDGISELLNHPWLSSIDPNLNLALDLSSIFQSSPIKSQNNFSLEIDTESMESLETQQKEEKITKMLHRDHVQQMFFSFNSIPCSEEVMCGRRDSCGQIERMSSMYTRKTSLKI